VGKTESPQENPTFIGRINQQPMAENPSYASLKVGLSNRSDQKLKKLMLENAAIYTSNHMSGNNKSLEAEGWSSSIRSAQ